MLLHVSLYNVKISLMHKGTSYHCSNHRPINLTKQYENYCGINDLSFIKLAML
jgi:hypothetical protein